MPIPQSFTPRIPDQRDETPRMVAQINARFWFVSHPSDAEPYTLDCMIADQQVKGTFWLPELSQVAYVPGSQAGMRTVGVGEPESNGWAEAKQRLTRKGATWLEWRDVPLAFIPKELGAKQALQYALYYECIEPRTGRIGKHWATPWDVPTETLPNEPQRWRFDRALFGAWVASLVADGTLPPASGLIRDARIKILEEDMERVVSAANITDENRDRKATKKQREIDIARSPIFTPDLLSSAKKAA